MTTTTTAILLILALLYCVGFIGMFVYLRPQLGETAWSLAAIWPATLVWLLWGNIQ